jgi:hypothetical protein
MSCTLVNRHRRLGETSVTMYQNMQSQISEDSNRHSHYGENLKHNRISSQNELFLFMFVHEYFTNFKLKQIRLSNIVYEKT